MTSRGDIVTGSATSAQLFERSLKVAPGGVHSPVRAFGSVGGTPVFFNKAEGPYLYSVEGRRYIDFCMSFGPLILGHRDPEISEVVRETIDRAWSFGACEPYSLELAEWITSRVPWAERIRFVSSGTEAVMSALRVARAATGRSKVLKFDGCYHGHVDSLLVKAGSGLAAEASSDSAGVPEHVAHDTIVARLDDEASVAEAFAKFGKDIACVILEPLPANYGLLPQRPAFWQAVVRLAREHGALVIFDEVISGFRVALGGMAHVLGIQPDLVTYGKVIGGGFPVGAYGGRKELMQMVAPAGRVYQAGTLSANPVGMRTGLATLKKMERLDGWQVLRARGTKWHQRLTELFTETGADLQAGFAGSLFWLHPKSERAIRQVDQIPKVQKENFKSVFHKVLAQDVYLAPSGFEVGFLSMAHTDDVMDEAWEKFKKALLA
jgi:glutamate-1-semialdehyde 2,1-aminomutase